jgi:MFS family permease
MIDLLRRNRDFRLLFAAAVVSLGGDWFATVALLGEVRDLTGSSVGAGLVFVAQSLPAFLATPLAGPVADRFNRRTVLQVVTAAQALTALGFLSGGPGRVWLFFAVQATIAFLGAFYSPAAQASVPNLVSAEDLPRASALLGGVWGAMLAVGAAAGGLFASVFGREAAFVADAASFALAFFLVSAIGGRTSAADGGVTRPRIRPLADTAEALRVARRDPVLLALLGSKAGFGLGTGVVGLLTVLASERYGGADGVTGALLGARGLGAMIGPIVVARHVSGDVYRVLAACGGGALLYAVGYGTVATGVWLGVAMAAVGVAHFGGGAQWSLSTYGLQARAPDSMRGRIVAADFALATLAMSISFVAAGALAEAVGTRAAMAVFAVISALWGAAYLTLTGPLRRRATAAAATT